MTNNEILIKVKTQTQQAVAGLKGLASALAAIGVLEFGRRIAGAGIELVKFGLQVDATRTRLELTLGSVGAADAYIRAIRETTNGAVDSFTAMNIALQAAQYGFAQTPEQVAELSKNILILSNGNAELAQSFLYMASNGVGSIERLNEFGLSAANVRRRMRELQAASADMSSETAFAEAVMAELNEVAGRLGGTMDTTAADVQRFNAAIKEMNADAGEAAATGLGAYIPILEAMIAKFQQTATEGQKLENFFTVMQAGFLGLGVAAQEMARGKSFAEAMDIGQQAANDAAVAMGGLSTAESRAADEAAAAAVDIGAEARALGDLERAADGAKDALDHMARITKRAEETNTDNPFEGLFGDTAQQLKDAEKAGLQGLASVGKQTDEADEDTIRQAVYQAIKSMTDDPVKLFRARKALGLATAGEIAKEEEMFRIVQLYASGRIDDSQLAAAVAALESGDMAGSQAIKGTALDPSRPSAQPRGNTGFGSSRGDAATSPYPNATQADHAANNRTVTVHITADNPRDSEIGVKLIEALKKAGVPVNAGGGPPRNRRPVAGGHRGAR